MGEGVACLNFLLPAGGVLLMIRIFRSVGRNNGFRNRTGLSHLRRTKSDMDRTMISVRFEASAQRSQATKYLTTSWQSVTFVLPVFACERAIQAAIGRVFPSISHSISSLRWCDRGVGAHQLLVQMPEFSYGLR